MKYLLSLLSLFTLISCSSVPPAISIKPGEISNYWVAKNEMSTVIHSKKFGCGVFSSQQPETSDQSSPSALVEYTITERGAVEVLSVTDYKNGLSEKDLELWINLINLSALKTYDSALPSPQPITVSEYFYLNKSSKYCK